MQDFDGSCATPTLNQWQEQNMPDLPDNMKHMLTHYTQGLELYRARKWDDAIGQFRKALEFVPDDGPSQLYITRSNEYKEMPPPDDWDGVYEAKTK